MTAETAQRPVRTPGVRQRMVKYWIVLATVRHILQDRRFQETADPGRHWGGGSAPGGPGQPGAPGAARGLRRTARRQPRTGPRARGPGAGQGVAERLPLRRSRPPRDTSDRGRREPRMADGRGPRIDLHSHAGRCFLAGLPAGHSLVAAWGAAAVADAVRAARAAGMTALVLAAVADFAVLRPDPATGLRAHRDFRAGEAYADYPAPASGDPPGRGRSRRRGGHVSGRPEPGHRRRAHRGAARLRGRRFPRGRPARGSRRPARPASPCSPWCTTGSATSATCRPRSRCTRA